MLSTATCAVLVASRAAPANAAPAVPLPHYDLAVQVDMDAASLTAREVLRFSNTFGVALDRLVFKTPAGAVASLNVFAALVDGQAVSWAVDPSGSVLDLVLNTSLAPGEATSVELDWSVQIPQQPGRLSAADDVISLGNWFPTLAVHRGDWDRRPYSAIGDPFFTEVADFDLQLDLSRPAAVAFTGDLIRQDGASWQIAARSVRDLAVAISPDYQRLDTQIAGGPDVSVYALDADRAQAELDAARTFVAAYAALVGPYPLATLRVAETGLQPAFAGMEYPGIVFVSVGIGPRASQAVLHGIVAHEVAHQWFYALIGDDELADPWLDEAFATYLPVEASESAPAQLSGVAGNVLGAAGDGPSIDQGIFDFQGNGQYASVVYGRGARFLAELRQTMGDPAWVSFLRMLYATYADKVETPRAVLDLACRAAPSTDLAPLIAQYTRDVARTDWSVSAPSGPWSGQVAVDVEAPFALSSVELWLDDRLLGSESSAGSVSIDASQLPAGDYVLLTRVTDVQGALYERASRFTIAP
jgi:hypothetical protein